MCVFLLNRIYYNLIKIACYIYNCLCIFVAITYSTFINNYFIMICPIVYLYQWFIIACAAKSLNSFVITTILTVLLCVMNKKEVAQTYE